MGFSLSQEHAITSQHVCIGLQSWSHSQSQFGSEQVINDGLVPSSTTPITHRFCPLTLDVCTSHETRLNETDTSPPRRNKRVSLD